MSLTWNSACDRCSGASDKALAEGFAWAKKAALDRGQDVDALPDGRITPEELAKDLQSGWRIYGGREGQRRCISAWALRDCIKAANVAGRDHFYFDNVHIEGELDFEGILADYALTFDNCVFDKPPKFEDARCFSLKITGCCLPGLRANGLELRHDLDLSGSHFHGAWDTRASMSRWAAVWLCDAQVGGLFLCVDTKIDGRIERKEPAHCSLYADRIKVGGPVRLIHDFSAVGQIRLIGAQIGGSLDLTGAEILPSRGQAIDLEDARIDGSVFIVEYPAHEKKITEKYGQNNTEIIPERRPKITGRIDMGSTRIASQLTIRKAVIAAAPADLQDGSYAKSAEPGVVIHAPRISVGARMVITDCSVVYGGIDMSMSELSGVHIGDQSRVMSPGRDAIILLNALVRGRLQLDATSQVTGTIRLTGAVVHGDLGLRGELAAPKTASLVTGSPMTVTGSVVLAGLIASDGRITFRGATIGSLDAKGAQLHNPGFEALNLKQTVVHGSVRLVNGFSAEGLVTLNRCQIAGRLLLRGGTFAAPPPAEIPSAEDDGALRRLESTVSKHAIEAISVDVRGGMDLRWTGASPSVDFSDSKTTTLTDDPGSWPVHTIAGLTYDRFAGPQVPGVKRRAWDARARRDWLAQQAEYDYGPYEQAARVLRQQGYVTEAERILMARHRHARRVERKLSDERSEAWKMRRTTALAEPGAEQRRTLHQRVLSATSPILGPKERFRGLSATSSGSTGEELRFAPYAFGVVASMSRRAVNWAYGAVGYGYRPARLFWALLGLIVAVVVLLQVPSFQSTLRANNGNGDVYSTLGLIQPSSAVQQAGGGDTCQDGQVRCFSAGLYAIDTVVPLISLDQRSTWYPDQHVPYGMFVAITLDTATILGWVLSSIFVLSFARFARNNR